MKKRSVFGIRRKEDFSNIRLCCIIIYCYCISKMYCMLEFRKRYICYGDDCDCFNIRMCQNMEIQKIALVKTWILMKLQSLKALIVKGLVLINIINIEFSYKSCQTYYIIGDRLASAYYLDCKLNNVRLWNCQYGNCKGCRDTSLLL